MSVKIVLGRSGSGKTASCIAEIEKKSKTEKNIYCIVPDTFSHKSEVALSEKLGACFEGEACVMTFKRLCARIFEKSARAGLKPLSVAGKSMMVMRAVWQVSKNLEVYKNSVDKAGFAKKITSQISELKRYGITENDLADAIDKTTDETLKLKLTDILKIYSRYNELFSSDFQDSEEDLFYAAAQLTKLDYLKGASIYIDEFSDFLPGHILMLEIILKRAASVTFYICMGDLKGENNGFFSKEEKSVNQIKDMCYRLGLDLKIEYMEKNLRHKERKDLLALEKNYTEHKVLPYEGECENVSIFEASDIFSEIEFTAGEIVSLCREQKLRYRDICVCAGDLALYEKAVSLVFNNYSIPYFSNTKEAVIENPMAVAILAVFDIFLYGYSYESVFSYLKSGFSNITADECDLLENYVLEAGINKNKWLSEEDWSFKRKFLSEEDEEYVKKADEIRRRVIAPIVKLKENIGVKNTVRQAATAIFEFIKELEMDKKVIKIADSFKQEGKIAYANLFIKTYNGILDVLNQIVTVLGDEKIGISQMKNLLCAGFENENISLIPQRADEVLFVSPKDARTADCKVMFLVGTNTGEFLNLSGEEGILSDNERAKLEKAGLNLAPAMKSKINDNLTTVYKALSKAEERLYLTYSLTDFESNANLASEIAGKAKRILPNIKVYSNLDKTAVYPYQFYKKYPAYLNLCVSMAKFAAGDKKNPIWQEVYEKLKNDKDYSEKIKKASFALNYKNEAKPLDEKICDMLYKNGINSSVSRLEKYKKCPFSYFIEFTLKAKERKILKIGAPDIGSIMHSVLEQFVKECISLKLDWKTLTEDEINALLLKITTEYYGGILKNTSADTKANRYLLGRIEKNLARCASLVVMHMKNSAFEVCDCELKFGLDGKIDAIKVDLGGKKELKIHGIIDRVDKCETENGTYFRVVDYKSGSKEFRLDKVFYGLDLQLAVYLSAVTRGGGKPAAMLYFKIKEPIVSFDHFADKEETEREITEMMRMDGLVLSDSDVLSLMDNSGNKKSKIIPVEYKNDGELKAYSKSASAKDFDRIFKNTQNQLKEIGKNIIQGRIDIAPCKIGDEEPCTYCKYKDVCRINKEEQKARVLKKLKKEEVYENLYKMYGKGE